MKKIILLLLSVFLTACTPSSTTNKNFINTKGTTLETRIPTPKGYTREQSDFAHFLQTYPLKENGSPILLYNGKKKWDQSAQIAVFKLPIENENLQQCADSVMRVYAEYYWHTKQYDKIQFHLSDGFLLSYIKWREGYRVVIKNDHASYVKSASYDDSGVTGEKSCWVLEAGAYGIYVGTDVRSAKKVCEVQLDELCVISRLEEALAPVQPYERLVPVETGKKGTDGETVLEIGKQAAPLRSVDLAERIRTERPEAEACIGDQGWKLADVCDKKVTLEQFLSQLSDEDLACLVRGEGMCSPKATPGIASAFGGVTDSLKAFGIPVAGCSDGPSGIRMDCGTIAFSLPNGIIS